MNEIDENLDSIDSMNYAPMNHIAPRRIVPSESYNSQKPYCPCHVACHMMNHEIRSEPRYTIDQIFTMTHITQ